MSPRSTARNQSAGSPWIGSWSRRDRVGGEHHVRCLRTRCGLDLGMTPVIRVARTLPTSGTAKFPPSVTSPTRSSLVRVFQSPFSSPRWAADPHAGVFRLAHLLDAGHRRRPAPAVPCRLSPSALALRRSASNAQDPPLNTRPSANRLCRSPQSSDYRSRMVLDAARPPSRARPSCPSAPPERSNDGHRLRSSPLRSDALHSAAHTCIPGNASTRKRHSENASVCLQGWRSRSDWKPGGIFIAQLRAAEAGMAAIQKASTEAPGSTGPCV
jgi:hypothetical protein